MSSFYHIPCQIMHTSNNREFITSWGSSLCCWTKNLFWRVLCHAELTWIPLKLPHPTSTLWVATKSPRPTYISANLYPMSLGFLFLGVNVMIPPAVPRALRISLGPSPAFRERPSSLHSLSERDSQDGRVYLDRSKSDGSFLSYVASDCIRVFCGWLWHSWLLHQVSPSTKIPTFLLYMPQKCTFSFVHC